MTDHFLAGTSARKTAEIVGVHRNTATLFFRKLRKLISKSMEQEEKLSNEVEIDERYLGKQRTGSPGRCLKGKVVLIGAKERSGKVRVEPAENARSKTIKSFVERNVDSDVTVYTDGFRSYNFLKKYGYKHHVVNHKKEFICKNNVKVHTNSIENVWKQIRRIFSAYNGVKVNLKYFLSYAMFRLNYPDVAIQRKMLRKWRMAS